MQILSVQNWLKLIHIIKKASIPEASAAQLATNLQNRGEVGAWEKFQHCLQNRVPRVQVLLPLPSIKEPVNAYITAFAGFFHAKIARMDTLYRYRISVAKFFKCPNIREYSNCRRLVHHQKSISEFREKHGSVPCAEERSDGEKKCIYFVQPWWGDLGVWYAAGLILLNECPLSHGQKVCLTFAFCKLPAS